MKKVIPYLKSASAISMYKLHLVFDDGISGVIDLSNWKGKGVFKYWDFEENFKNFTITGLKKLEWNDKIEMDPDAFYLKLTGKTFDDYADNKQLLWHSH
jgi:hypothetical protein